MKLTAKRPILYRSKQYKVGEQLPADNQVMVDAWLEAESAEWIDETKNAPTVEPEAKAPKDKEPEVEEPKTKTTAKKAAAKKGAK